jgi:hypothetical protein
MRKHTIAIVAGLLAFAGLASYAHSDMPGHGHGPPARLHSLSGSPAELANRSQMLAEHVCAEVGAEADCTLRQLALSAADELNATQAGYLEGQMRLHQALLAEPFVRGEVERIAGEQTQDLLESSLRYTRFLGDCAAALSPQQKQILISKVQQAKH